MADPEQRIEPESTSHRPKPAENSGLSGRHSTDADGVLKMTARGFGPALFR
jgi:hypothetical protein